MDPRTKRLLSFALGLLLGARHAYVPDETLQDAPCRLDPDVFIDAFCLVADLAVDLEDGDPAEEDDHGGPEGYYHEDAEEDDPREDDDANEDRCQDIDPLFASPYVPEDSEWDEDEPLESNRPLQGGSGMGRWSYRSSKVWKHIPHWAERVIRC